jgi:hypothetical protein
MLLGQTDIDIQKYTYEHNTVGAAIPYTIISAENNSRLSYQ